MICDALHQIRQQRWEIGISTGAFFEEALMDNLPLFAQAGFTLVEICSRFVNLDSEEEVVILKETLQKLHLTPYSFHLPYGDDWNLSSPIPEVRERTLWQMKKGAQFLHRLGGKILVVHAGERVEGEEREKLLDFSREGLKELFEYSRGLPLSLAVENSLPHLLGGQAEDLAYLLEGLPSGVGLCLDTSHALLGGNLFEIFELFGERIIHTHISDNRGFMDDHLIPEEGLIDWREVIEELGKANYQGVFMLEVVPQTGEDKTEFLRRAREKAEDLLRR